MRIVTLILLSKLSWCVFTVQTLCRCLRERMKPDSSTASAYILDSACQHYAGFLSLSSPNFAPVFPNVCDVTSDNLLLLKCTERWQGKGYFLLICPPLPTPNRAQNTLYKLWFLNSAFIETYLSAFNSIIFDVSVESVLNVWFNLYIQKIQSFAQ